MFKNALTRFLSLTLFAVYAGVIAGMLSMTTHTAGIACQSMRGTPFAAAVIPLIVGLAALAVGAVYRLYALLKRSLQGKYSLEEVFSIAMLSALSYQLTAGSTMALVWVWWRWGDISTTDMVTLLVLGVTFAGAGAYLWKCCTAQIQEMTA